MKKIRTHGRAGFYLLVFSFPLLACAQQEASTSTNERLKEVPEQTGIKTLSIEEHCEAVIASVREAGFEDEAWVTCDEGHAYIHSDSYASHEMMTGIVGTNEQIPVPAPGYYAPIKFNPSFTGSPQTRDSSLAIAVNGVPIFDYTAGGELGLEQLYYHQPHLDAMMLEQIDNCGGHTGRGDDYHYHEIPRCMIEQMDNKDENPIIGWGFDGFPLYGNNNPDGSVIKPGTLDVCNGQLDDTFGYRYHTSDSFPYILQCLVGNIEDLSSVPSIGLGRPIGRPVNVENLAFEHDGRGNGLLTYEYRGDDFYIKSMTTDVENCFDFEWKTITNGGIVETGQYCNTIRTGRPANDRGAMGGEGMGR